MTKQENRLELEKRGPPSRGSRGEGQHDQGLEDIEPSIGCSAPTATTWAQCERGDHRLFADRPETSDHLRGGHNLGLEGERRYFGKMKTAPPEFLHMGAAGPPSSLWPGRGAGQGPVVRLRDHQRRPQNGANRPQYIATSTRWTITRENGVGRY